MSKKNKLLERQVIDHEPVKVSKIAGVNKVRVPSNFKKMSLLKHFFQCDLEMLVVMEEGKPHLEIRVQPKEADS